MEQRDVFEVLTAFEATQDVLLICHRGFHADEPENSLGAFQAAERLGADGIETDVRLSADGQAILMHDRVASDGRDVSDLTRAELSGLAGVDVPILDEALDGFPALLWVVEIKTPHATEAVVSALRRCRPGARCLVISFWHTVVREIVARCQCRGGVLMSHNPLRPDSVLLDHGTGEFRSIVWNYEFLDARTITCAKSRGYINFAYGPQTVKEHRHCRELLDGVITDHPGYVLATGAQREDSVGAGA